ncbi:small GTPase superfamily [Aspergillus californicus]
MWIISDILITGSEAVGKKSLLSQFVNGRFNEEYQQSIGLNFQTKRNFSRKTEPYTVDYRIWHCTHADCIYSRRASIYRKMAILVVAYSITSASSLSDAQRILGFLKFENINAKVFLVGLKADLEDQREVSTAAGEEMASGYDALFRELSAKNAIQVEEFFEEIAHL